MRFFLVLLVLSLVILGLNGQGDRGNRRLRGSSSDKKGSSKRGDRDGRDRGDRDNREPKWRRRIERRNRRNQDGTMDETECDYVSEDDINTLPIGGPLWGGCILWSATLPGIEYTGEEDMEFDVLYSCDGCFQNGIGGLTGDHPGRSYGRYNCGDWDVHTLKEECANDPDCVDKYSYICDRADKLFDRFVKSA